MANPYSAALKPVEPNFIDIGGGLSLDYTGVPDAPKTREEFNILNQLEDLDNRDEAAKLTFVGRKNEGDLGLQRAFLGAFNKAVLYLPDAAINAAIRGMESEGILKAPVDPAQNRDFLERTFNAVNFEQKEKILGFLNVGVPGTEILPSTPAETIADAAGTGAAIAVPIVGATKGLAKTAEPVFEVIKPLYDTTKLVSKGAPYSTVQKKLIQQRALENPSLGNTTQKILVDILNAFQKNPGRFVASEVVGSAIGAGASQAEIQYTPLRTSTDEPINTGILGLLAGVPAAAIVESPKAVARYAAELGVSGITGIPLIGALIRKGVNKIYADNYTDQGAQQAVRAQLQPIFQQALKNAEETGDFQRTVEILKAMDDLGIARPKLSAAEQFLDTPLGITQSVLQKGAKGQEARDNVNRIQSNIQKAYDFARKMLVGPEDVPIVVKGGTNKAPSAVEDFMAAIEKTQRTRAEGLVSEQEALDEELIDLAQRFPGLSKEGKIDLGNKIVGTLVADKTAKREELLNLEKELGLDNMGAKDFSSLKLKLQSILDEKFTKAAKDLIPDSLLRLINSPSSEMSFDDYRAARNAIGDSFQSSNDSFNTTLKTAKEQLDQWADQAFGTGYRNWRVRWKNEYEIPYQEGIVQKITKNRGSKENPIYVLNGENVASGILREGTKDPQNVVNYIQLLKLNQNNEGITDLRNAVTDLIYDKAFDYEKNQLNPTKYSKFLRDNEIVLKELNLFDSLSNNTSTIQALASRQANLAAREKQIKADQISKLLAYKNSDTGALSASEVIDNMLKNPNELGKTYKQIVDMGDEGLTAAFRKATLDRVFSTMEDGPDAFADAVVNNAASLKRIMSPEEFDKYTMVNDLLHRIRFAERNKEGSGTDYDSFLKRAEKYIGTRIPTVAAYYRAMIQSKQSPMFLGATLATRFISTRQQSAFDAMHKKAMDGDMEFIKDLATETLPSGGAPRPTELRLRSALFSVGVPSLFPVEESPMIEYTLDDNGRFVPVKKDSGAGGAPPAPPAASVTPEVPPKVQKNITVDFLDSDPSPSNSFNQPPPNVLPPANGSATGTNYQSLFPYDELGGAISDRRQ